MTAPVRQITADLTKESLAAYRATACQFREEATTFQTETVTLLGRRELDDRFASLGAQWEAAMAAAAEVRAAFKPVDQALAAGQSKWPGIGPALDAAYGAADFIAAENAYYGCCDALADALMSLQPRNLAEVAFKYRVMLERYGDGGGDIDQPEPFFAFAGELAKLASVA